MQEEKKLKEEAKKEESEIVHWLHLNYTRIPAIEPKYVSIVLHESFEPEWNGIEFHEKINR